MPHALGFGFKLRKGIRWDQANGQRYQRGQNDQVIKVAEYGDEIGDQVDGGKGISDCNACYYLCHQRGVFAFQA
ncbi:hypothetical protein SDC9_117963 [bioreactor metagenome]|uniref:Uncharacterized protein n=1 Tax=bioreactor metagenome TaxID=1076179 RepID=A0A645BZQ5_9ZZZZ